MIQKPLLVILCTFILSAANAQITRIEHFFVTSPKAEKLLMFFNKELGLPVIWPYKSWGSFSSGAVTLGNVAFEFANYDGITNTKFDGIALEPKQPVEEFIIQLDANNILHDTVENNTYRNKNGKLAGWSTLSLNHLLPKEANLFICDYKEREMIFLNRKMGSDSLKKMKGGPLGVILLKEIVVGSSNFSEYEKNLSKLPGIKTKQQNVYSFQHGPSIRLKKSGSNGIEEIVIRVRSLASAINYLRSKNLLGKTTKKSVYIAPAAMDGLQVQLVE